MTGSSWHFNRFLCVSVKILDSISKMTGFINFEADDVDDDFIDGCELQTVSDNEFIDDETQIDNNLEDYYAFTNVFRSAEDAMQDSFLDSDSSESQPNEVSNYCNDNYDPKSEQTNKFRVSAKRIEEFMHTLLSPQQFEKSGFFLLCNSLCYSLSA